MLGKQRLPDQIKTQLHIQSMMKVRVEYFRSLLASTLKTNINAKYLMFKKKRGIYLRLDHKDRW